MSGEIYPVRVRRTDRLYSVEIPALDVHEDGLISEMAAWRRAAGLLSHELVRRDLELEDVRFANRVLGNRAAYSTEN